MFVRVNQVRFKPGMAEAARAIAKNELIPLMKSMKGFKHWYAIQSIHDPDMGLSIGFWDSQADFERARMEERYLDSVRKMRNLYVEPPTDRYYEVKLQS